MNIEKIDKWLDKEYGISYTELTKIKEYLIAELQEANDSIEWWHNRYKALQNNYDKELSDKLLIDYVKLQQRIDRAVKYIEKQYELIKDSDEKWQPVLDNKKLLKILRGE